MRIRTLGPTGAGTFDRRRNYWGYTKRSNLSNVSVWQTTDPSTTILPSGAVYRTMEDINTPGFLRLRNSGVIINNAMSQTYTLWDAKACRFGSFFRLSRSSGTVRHYEFYNDTNPAYNAYGPFDCGLSNSFSAEGYFEPSNVPDVTLVPDDDLLEVTGPMVTEVWAKMTDTPLNAWVIVGEFNESVRTIIWAIQRIIDLIYLLKGKVRSKVLTRWQRIQHYGRKVHWAEVAQESAGFWLQMRYGIRPLIYDIFGALKVLEQLGEASRQRFSATAETVVGAASSEQLRTGQNADILHECTRQSKLTVRAGLLADACFDKNILSSLVGMGNIAQGAWDLVPFSFVVDWVFNVGQVIASWSPSGYIRPLASWATVLREDDVLHTVLPTGGIVAPIVSGFSLSAESVTMSQIGYVRKYVKMYNRIPEPPRPVLPPLDLRLNTLKVVDLLALVSVLGNIRSRFKA